MRIGILGAIVVFAAACAGTASTSPTTSPRATTTTSPAAVATSTPTQAAATQAAAALNCTAPAQPLVVQTEGPYYKAGAPQRASLVTAGVVGTPVVLTGYVVTRSCQPIANAKLDFWQADGAGNYDNSGFNLRGWLTTDSRGAYRLETVLPGQYPGRTEHIHVKVTPPGGQTYTSQLYFPDSTRNANDSIYSARMLVTLDKTTNPVSASFTFVVDVA